jgi:hypothetical protein
MSYGSGTLLASAEHSDTYVQEARDSWVDCISHLVLSLSSLSHQKEYELFLKNSFRKADANNSGYLSTKEVGCPPLVILAQQSVTGAWFVLWLVGALNTVFGSPSQGADPPPPPGRWKSFERVNYPSPAHWNRQAL